MKRTTMGFLLTTILGALVGAPPLAADTWGTTDEAARIEQHLFDALRNDPSPRVQVLAGGVWIDEADAGNALRPKRADVVARAVALAPNDAFVQWVAAREGSYLSSQCGPADWPLTEVANLVHLEPGNAGALMYEVALAQAQGDPDQLDAALARMAAAREARDHRGEEIALWRALHARIPAVRAADPFTEPDAPAAFTALRYAQQRGAFAYSSAARAVEAACTPDAQSERAWQRLGWCADAGRLLAAEGTSFALRELGLKLLGAAGSDELAHLQHQVAWLRANAPDPYINPAAFADEAVPTLADWQDADGDIAATFKRLDRLDLPRLAPADWNGEAGDALAGQAMDAWFDFIRATLADMLASDDANTQALALAGRAHLPPTDNEDEQGGSASLDDLARKHPDQLLVQWLAAGADGTPDSAALERLQRIDGDNAATWALALAAGAQASEALPHMARARRYDPHFTAMLEPWLAAMEKRPPSAELIASQQGVTDAVPPGETPTPERFGRMTAVTMAMGAYFAHAPELNLATTCRTILADPESGLRDACTASARVLFDSGTLVAVMAGTSVLEQADALQPADQARLRQLAWWRSLRLGMAGGADFDAWMLDYLTTGSEIEALRLAAVRAGKAEPPADWQPPGSSSATAGEHPIPPPE